MLKHHSGKTFVECRHSRKLEFHFFCFARLQSDTLSPLTRSFGFLFRAERWRSVFQWAPCGAQEVTLGPAAVPSSLLNREFLQLCTSCIFSVLGRCACYKIVTTTYLSESLSMCILISYYSVLYLLLQCWTRSQPHTQMFTHPDPIL